MLYGPEGAHGPAPGDGPMLCKQKPNESLLPPGLSAAEVKVEMAQWQNAYAYHKTTGQIDIAYTGIFFRDSVSQWCSLITLTQPDWIFLDDECCEYMLCVHCPINLISPCDDECRWTRLEPLARQHYTVGQRSGSYATLIDI
jgi:hypothetical protein